MTKYRLLKLPSDSIWTMFHTYSKQQIEQMLCLISQGYTKELYNNIIYDYVKQGKGFFESLVKLIIFDEEVDVSY
jgi:hypothetical protein